MIARLVRFTTILSLVIFAWSVGASADVVVRKNIDLLTPDELAAYEHAIQILKDRSFGKLADRSDANPFDKSGYLWQAWVHNCFVIWQPTNGARPPHSMNCDSVIQPPPPGFDAISPGACEHHKNLFLLWHRAQFYYFEKILQATDPDGTVTDGRSKTGPSTRNVGVPFWNWTGKLTGKRYSSRLEDPNSPLFNKDRNQDAPTGAEKETLDQITSAKAIAALVYNPDWRVFGGYPQESSTGGGGEFEYQHHDLMHTEYFGKPMSSTSTAALDPGFFSFHAYIDLLLQFWIEQHGTQAINSLKTFLRATQPDGITPPLGYSQGASQPSMGQLEIYLDPAKLGYRYEVTDQDKLPPPQAVDAALASAEGSPAVFAATPKSRYARLSGSGFFEPSAGPPTMTAEITLPVPASVTETRAVFMRPHDAPDVNFKIDFYLHPATIKLDLTQKVDREKYIVVALGHLGRGDDSQHHDKPLFVDLTRPLKDLATTGHRGESWTLTAIVSGQPQLQTFGTLSLAP
jgi:tyrosinase